MELAEGTRVKQAILSGGVFQNRSLATETAALLSASGIETLENAEVICNDGGVSLGQVTIAATEASK